MIEMTNFKRGQCRDIESPRSQVFGQFFHISMAARCYLVFVGGIIIRAPPVGPISDVFCVEK